jgi:hydroxymethylbilane synthase
MRANPTLRIGSRGSPLALWQATWVQKNLATQGIVATLTVIRTTGDKILDVPLAQVGGKGLFVKEIEEALLNGEIDLAVHSMKDVPTQTPAPLLLAVIPKREDPRDAFIGRQGVSFADLPTGAVIGSSSLRRQSQLLARRPDLTCLPLRGNLDTRLRKLTEGVCDAIILAAAGLRRMGWEGQITEYLPPDFCLPAIGQGALGLECRKEDAQTRAQIAFLNDPETACCVTAERALLLRLEGGCQTPIAGHATRLGDHLTLTGLVASLDGAQIIREQQTGPAATPEALGIALAERLLARGADVLLTSLH